MIRSLLASVLFALLLVPTSNVWAANPFEALPSTSFETGAFNTPSAVSARAYAQWFRQCLSGLENDLPQITASAETAAAKYLGTFSYGSVGEESFKWEVAGRAGGIIQTNVFNPGDTPGSPQILLFEISEANKAADLANVTRLHNLGHMVVIFARKEVIQYADAHGILYDTAVDTHAAPHGGLIQQADGTWVIDTDMPAKMTAVWVWIGEFIGACTRLGKMPPCYQSYAVPGAPDRTTSIGNVKFHNYVPLPCAQGLLGGQYLRELWVDFAGVLGCEMDDINTAASLALSARRAGHHVYTYAVSHSLNTLLPSPFDTGYFTQNNLAWGGIKAGMTPVQGDYELCIGYDSLFRGAGNGNFVENARTAGATLSHSITSYNQAEVNSILPTELYIDQHWDYGDAVAYPPGYDIKILPSSGVIAEAMFWMVNAQMYRMLNQR